MQDKKITSNGLKGAYSNHYEINESSIFELTVPHDFALGKNEVKINLTSRYLKKDTEVLVDVNDSQGKPIYYEISPIANTDNSRSIIVYIDEETAIGKSELMLFCTLINNETYKCVLNINVLSGETSISDVKFTDAPTVIYSEKRVPVQEVKNVSRKVEKTFSPGVISTIGGIVPKELYSDRLTIEVRELVQNATTPTNKINNGIGTSSIQEVPSKLNYSVISGQSLMFSSSMVGGTIFINGLSLEVPSDAVSNAAFQNHSYSASILGLINTSSIEVFPPFFKEIEYIDNSGNKRSRSFDRFFNHANFTASYYEVLPLTETKVTQSYAVFDILGLDSVSGKVENIEISYKAIGSLDNTFKPLGVFDVEPTNLLVDKNVLYFDSDKGIVERPIGVFPNGVSDYFTYWTNTGNQPATTSKSPILSDGVLLTFPPAYTGSGDAMALRPKDTFSVLVGKNSIFELSATVYAEKVFEQQPQIDVYISGSPVTGLSNIPLLDNTPLRSASFGTYIGSFDKNVRKGVLEFSTREQGYIIPVLVARYANWHIADIALSPQGKEGFNPNQVRLVASTNLISGSELTLKVDYIDAKGKKSKYSSILDKVYFEGSYVPASISGSGGGSPTPVLPSGLVSSSDQLTSSYDGRYERTGRNIVSSSLQFNNVSSPFTGSFYGDGSGLYNLSVTASALPKGVVSGSDQLTGSFARLVGDNNFYGNQYISASGSTVFSVNGSVGQLFSITDSLSGSLFSVNDISGIPIIEVFSDDIVKIGKYTQEAIKVSASFAEVTGSFKGDASGLYNLPTSSLPTGVITGSDQLTSSYDTRYERKGTGLFSSSNQVSYTGLLNVPANIVSSSGQITYSGLSGISLGIVSGSTQLTSSLDTRYEIRGNNIVSSSAQIKAFLPAASVSGSDQLTSSFDTRYERKGTNIFSSSNQVTFSGLTGIPLGLVSGSTQLTSSYDTRYEVRGSNIVSSSAQIKSLLPNGSVTGSDQLTSSYDSRYERKGTGLFSSSNQVSYTGLLNVPANIVSSSNQITYSGLTGTPLGIVSGSTQLTSSYDTRYEVRGNNIVSSSAQIKDLLPINSVTGSDQLTSSYDARYERKGTGLFSSSNQVSYTGLLNVPANIVSSSNQISYSGLTGIPLGIVSGSTQLTSSYDVRYERTGNGIVSSSAQVKVFLPTGTISSSQQFNTFSNPFTGSFTGSFGGAFSGDGSGLYNIPLVSGSVPNGTVTGSDQLTSSYDVRYEKKGSGLFSSSNQVSYTGLLNVPANIVSSSTQITYSGLSGIPLGIVSGSTQLTSSYDTRYEIRGNNIVSSSAQIKAFLPASSVSGSDQLTSSYDTRYEIRGNNIVSSSAQVKNLLPAASVSGSDQLTSSYDTRYERKGTGLFSSSNQVSYTGLLNVPANIVSSSNQVAFSGLTGIPLGLVSSSVQLTSSFDTRYEIRGNNIVSSSAQVKSLLPVGSVTGSDQLTSSYDTRYERKGTGLFSSSNQVSYTGLLNVPANIVSSSNQITYSGLSGTPLGIVSGSAQLTSSYDSRYEVRGSNIVSSSAQIKSLLPTDVISSSQQFNNTLIPFTGSFTGSFVGDGSGLINVPGGGSINTSSFATTGSNTFNGNQTINGLVSIYKSGSIVFDVQGSSGPLFTITDTLSGSLFNVKNISGIPIFEVFSDNVVKIGKYGQEAIVVSASHATVSGSFYGDGSGLYNVPTGSTVLPAGLVSGSNQLTSSYDTRYEIRGNNIVSSSAQVKSFLPNGSVTGSDQLTSSYDTRYERKGTNIYSSSNQVDYNQILNKPIIANPRTDRLITSDGTVSGSRVNDGIQFTSSSKWTKFIFRNDVIQEQGYSSSFWTSEWKFVSQSIHSVSSVSRNYSVYIPLAINNDTNTPITSSTFHSSYAIEVENHIYGLTGSLASPINTYNWASVTQFRALSNPLDFTVKPRLSGYVAQSSSQYVGLGGYGTTFTGKADLNSWYSVTGVDYASDGLVQVNYSLGPSSSGAWTIYVATVAKVIKHEIRI